DEIKFPDFQFGVFDDAIIYDHRKKTVKYAYLRENRLAQIKSHLKDSQEQLAPLKVGAVKTNFGEKKYCELVERAKEYIRAGETFQTVLSRRFEMDYSGDFLPFYTRLKQTNPSPYLYYLKFGDRHVVGSSPENLIRVEGRAISSYATLAGTRVRGKTPLEDAALEKELLSDPKERAEHLMLVDLTRNDVGKIAKIGSVKVPKLMEVHKFSRVQHIASLVTGELAEGKTCFDAFNSIFPAGTVSGAPKIRAIEIIKELEKTSRGPYAGAVGYFSSNGNADFAIGIRTLFADRKKAFVQAGAGIVYDSVAEKEFVETQNKASALFHALGVADGAGGEKGK
ncbi:anthranilate synthase component I family protein, partial [Candidatus Micrarchaeota archaeon]|nr:anthranilate synthase component I family protein [Candidatus Micrarchaeota archaeon]